MNVNWLTRVIQKVGASNKSRVKNKIRSNSRGLMRQHLRGFEALEDRRVLASYSFINNGTTIQLNLAANEALAVTTSSNLYTLTLTGGNWSGPNDGRVAGATTAVLSVTDTPSISIIDGGANASVTFGSSISYIANVTVVLDDPAAGAITFNNPTSFVGTAALSASTSRNIAVNSGANITTVNGGLTLNANQQATGTTGTFVGVDVNSATVSTTGTGALSIAGKGGATSGVGVRIRGTGIVETTGTSSITVNGGTGASASLGVQLDNTAIVRKSTGTGSITLIGDTMSIGATTAINAGTANSVTLRQRTNTVAIDIGGVDTLAATPVLGLSDAELDLITAATVNIGNANSGAITMSTIISPLNYKTLATGNNTTFAAASEFIADVGPTAAVFEKITVAGTVTIEAGAKLSPVAIGGFVPSLLNSFTFLANDLTDAITGTFTLNVTPSDLTAFLGSAFTASASYIAGTGNDFVIAVPQNIAPTFNLGADPSVNEDAGPQTIVGFATGITAGGDPLPAQTLTFTTSGFNASLFSVAPSISPTTGNLTFTSAPNIFGSTAVTVTLQDSGGTLNGGVDTTVRTFTITINSVNDLPVAVNDAAATTELGTTTGSGSVLSNDTDADTGETATLVVDVPGTFTGTFGTLTLAADGTFSYTANANQLTVGQTVTDNFTYRARDVNGGLSNTASLVITLTGENDAPVAANDTGATTEIGTTTASVFSNDADPDTGETATLVVDVPGTFTGTNGTLTLGANGTYSYTANVNQLTVGQTVSDSFTYQARDVNGTLSNVATLVVTVTGENDVPVAAADAAATTELGTTTGSGSVLSNDTDADTGETATLVVDVPGTFTGTFGTLILAADGTFSYAANANQVPVGQTVTDNFTYRARDVNGGLSALATLVVTITGENDAPVAANDAGATTEIGTTTGSVLSNDTDPDTGETATLVVDVPGTFTGTNGTLTLGANGAYSYTANVNQLTVGQTVSDSFTYQARDVNGTLSNVVTLVVTVTGENDVPVAAADAAATTELGTTTGSGSVLSNDTDADTGETATLVVDVPGTFTGTFGTLTLAADGTFSYTATANQVPVGQTVTDNFTYRARDVNGGLSALATLVVTITGENDAPVAANDAGATTEIGTTTASVFSNDADPDTGETATLVVDVPGTFSGVNGTLTLGANGAYSYTANVNQLTVGQTVSDSFTYQARDVNGTLSNVATLVVTVTGENDVPVAAADAAATTELGTTTGSGSVLSNDTDADTGETATLVVDVPGAFTGTFGTLTLAADGTFSYTANANQVPVGQTVTDNFTYRARDVNGGLSDLATLVITITGENDAPVAANDAGATTETGTTTGTVLSNDTDPDTGETATLVVDVPGTFVGTNGTLTLGANGAYSYTANVNQLTVGQTVSDSFAYQARDVNGTLSNVVTLVVTVTGENDVPVAAADAAATTELGTTTGSGSVLSNDTDADTGETATLVVDVPGTFTGTFGTLTLAADGTFSYTAAANQVPVGQTVTDNFTYRARDVNGGLSALATLVVTITGENDAPVAANDAGATTETGTTTGTVLSNDTDPDTGETATLVVNAPGTFVGTNGTLTLGANGTYSYTASVNQLAAGQTVSDSFTYQARDVNGTLSNVATLVVTVTGENDAPTAVAYSLPGSVSEGVAAAVTITGVTDVDVPDTFTYNYVLKKNGVAVQTSGFVSATTFNLTPDDGGPGIVWTVEVQARDAAGDVSPVNAQSLTVNNVAPGLTRANASVTGDAGTTLVNTGTYADVSADTVTLTADVGTIVNNNDGTWSWSFVPAAAIASQTVTITGTDEDGGSSSVTFTITALNTPPVVASDSAAVSGNEGTTVTNTGTWSDANATNVVTLSASVGTVVKNANGTWSWSIATTDQLSATTVTITANDGVGGTASTSFTYTVINVAPALTRANATLSGNVGATLTNTGTYSDVAADTVTLTADIGTIVNNGNGTWSWSFTPAAAVSNQVVTITGSDEDGGSSAVTFTYTAVAANATVATRAMRYLGSTGTSASTSLAADKVALLPGQSSTFANYSSYVRGINGIVVDVNNLPASTTNSQMLASLQFREWNGIGTVNFAPLSGAAIASVSIVAGAGVGGSSRVTITFPDNTVQNTWLQVTVLANANTGLAANDVFYFGNVIGEVNIGNTVSRLRVNGQDAAAILGNQSPGANSASVTNIYDLNRDGRVNGQDYALVLANQQAAGIVGPITAPSARPAASRAFSAASSGNAAPLQLPLGSSKSESGSNTIVSSGSILTPALVTGSSAGNSVSTETAKSDSATQLLSDIISIEKKEKVSSSLKNVDAFFASLWDNA